MSQELDEVEHLLPGFEPSTLTVPRLRNILLAHGVNYPSSAKKPQLIQLFDENVAPQAKKLLSTRARTKRSTRGIVDVPSSQASTVDEEEQEDEAMPQPRLTRARSTQRTTHHVEADNEVALVAPSSEAPRRTTSKHARSSDVETEMPLKQQRRSRQSKTPTVTAHEPIVEPWNRRLDADSPFSSDNPFQSGSSPPAEARADSRRRKSSMGPAKEKRKSTASRRKTDGGKEQDQDGDIKPPSRATFEMPTAQLRRKKSDEYEDNVPAGEEFTPEETLDLVSARAKSGELAVITKRKKSRKGGSAIAKVAPLSIVAAMLSGFGFVWRQEKIELGYCGIGREPASELGGLVIPTWAKELQPQCEPCPPHAFCYQNLETSCETGFLLKPHPLSLNGLIPLPPTCEPDSEKARRVVAVADRAVEELRERNAKYECGEPTEQGGKPPASPAILEDELKESMSSQRRKKMTQEEFEQLWDGAVEEIRQRDEIVSDLDGRSSRTLRSTSLARQSFTCAIKQSIRHTIRRYIWQLVASLLLGFTASYTRYSITYNRATDEKAKKLASYALDRLHTQAALHAGNPQAYPDPYLSMGHLRDDILREEFSATRRTKIWQKVQGKVEGNLNVRFMVREGRHGDVSRVWEWTGAVLPIEDGGASSASSASSSAAAAAARRWSARGHLSGGTTNSPSLIDDGYAADANGRLHAEYSTVPNLKSSRNQTPGGDDVVEKRRWQESRPIY